MGVKNLKDLALFVRKSDNSVYITEYKKVHIANQLVLFLRLSPKGKQQTSKDLIWLEETSRNFVRLQD
jgi:hypothetical protein